VFESNQAKVEEAISDGYSMVKDQKVIDEKVLQILLSFSLSLSLSRSLALIWFVSLKGIRVAK
jgi:hypothetical protein